jgi:hypothetical protein
VQARLDEDDEDGRRVQAESQSDREPFDVPTIASIGSAPLADIKEASLDLKKRIDEAKRPHGAPVGSALGNPEEERNADGRADLPSEDGD